ncbi:MAG: 50S ribosomal protein L29 [Chitinophagales bacterium]
MAKKKKVSFRELGQEELIEKLEDETRRLQKLKLNQSITPLVNSNELKFIRRDIARMKTELRARELQGA